MIGYSMIIFQEVKSRRNQLYCQIQTYIRLLGIRNEVKLLK
jgi:hypothetical protein